MLHIIVVCATLLSGCANKVMPGGGSKDTTPPKVVQTKPAQNEVLFSGEEVLLVFDEYVQLKDASKQIVISPPVFPKPAIQATGKSVKITFDKLADSTTYVISFGKAITDVNEGNVLESYRFVFSTGSVLDTLFLSGRAFDMHNGLPLKNGLAMLYKYSGSNTVMDTLVPDHFARCDENGRFKIENASSGKYRLAVLSEKNDNLILDESSEKAGFFTQVISLPDSNIFDVWASEQPPSKRKIVSANLVPPATLVTAFNFDAQSAIFESGKISFEGSKVLKSIDGDTIMVYLKEPPGKTPVELIWSLDGMVLDTSTYRSRALTETVGDKLSLTFVSDVWDNPEIPARLTLSAPLQSFVPEKISIMLDSVLVTGLVMAVSVDSMSLEINRPNKPGNYSLRMDRGAIVDMYGRLSDSCVFKLVIPEEKTRGAVAYRFKGVPSAGSILQLMNESGQVVRSAVCEDGSDGDFTMLPPGKYRLRMLEDRNGNGRWDKGNIRTGIQPEWYTYHDSEITVRGNWEVEVELTLR